MGISLSYCSAQSVSSQVSDKLRQEARDLFTNYDWWCEPIFFFEQPLQGPAECLEGASKLFLPGYTDNQGQYVEVDAGEGDFMSSRDARFILNRLAAWSMEHRITWTLQMAGIDLGTIHSGAIPDRTIDAFQRELGWDILVPVDEGRAREISKKYASRND